MLIEGKLPKDIRMRLSFESYDNDEDWLKGVRAAGQAEEMFKTQSRLVGESSRVTVPQKRSLPLEDRITSKKP